MKRHLLSLPSHPPGLVCSGLQEKFEQFGTNHTTLIVTENKMFLKEKKNKIIPINKFLISL
jgi:hypothetical protein